MEKINDPFPFELCAFEKIRDGRHGPVFRVLDTSDTPSGGRFMRAERLDLEEPALQKALSMLQQKPEPRRHSYAVLNYIGYQRHEGHTYLLTEHPHGGTILDFVSFAGENLAVYHAQKLLRDIVQGLEEAYTDYGFTVVFLDASEVWLTMANVAKIEITYIDSTVTGQQPFRPSALTVPEMVFGRGGGGGNLRKADVWLLGIVAAQLLSRRCDHLVPDFAAAAAVAARVLKQGRTGSGLELLLPDHADVLPRHPLALDFVQRCLAVNSDERPTVAELRDHPFLAEEEGTTQDSS